MFLSFVGCLDGDMYEGFSGLPVPSVVERQDGPAVGGVAAAKLARDAFTLFFVFCLLYEFMFWLESMITEVLGNVCKQSDTSYDKNLVSHLVCD